MTEREILDSWKEISRYLKRDVRTCQRWERELHLPVHRLDGSPKARVFAYKDDLEDWLEKKSYGKEKRFVSVVARLAVFVLAISGFVLWRLAANPPRNVSLAVLPLNYSGELTQETFADGLTDRLIAGLGQIKALSIRSRTSVMKYRDTKKMMPEIASELRVKWIIEASVARSRNRVLVTASLIDARKDRQIWTQMFEREAKEIESLRSDLIQAIVREVKVRITPQESQRLLAFDSRRVDPDVYETTLKAMAIVDAAMHVEEVRRAIELFQKAVDRDPNYALAWAGLSEATWYLAVSGFEDVPPAEVRDQAIAYAEKAIGLDELLPEAYMARAVIALDGEWDLAMAQRMFEKALELNPGYWSALSFYAQMLGNQLQRFDDARRYLDRARELAPHMAWNDCNLVMVWQHQGRPMRALEEAERARLRYPEEWLTYDLIGDSLILLGRPDQATAEFEAAVKLQRDPFPVCSLAALALAYGLTGRRADAEKIVTEMEQASEIRYVSPFFLAVAHSGVGRMDEAFQFLDRALELRVPYLVNLTPFADMIFILRQDPRWKPYIERVAQLVKLPPGVPNPYL